MDVRTTLVRSAKWSCNKRKPRKIGVLCIALALLSQGCSPTAHSERAPYSNAYFPPGYLISPNPPVPAPGSDPGDKACRNVAAVRTSVLDLSEPSNVEVIPSSNQATLNDRSTYDDCAIQYANNARAEYVRAGCTAQLLGYLRAC